MIQDFSLPTLVCDAVQGPLLLAKGLSLSVLRTELIDPQISGNKYFKLKYNLLKAHALGHDTVLSFGGAWSNHLHALAAAGKRFGFNTIGVVRGESKPLNACLEDAQNNGMQLIFISREDYRKKHLLEFQQQLRSRVNKEFFLIPEGGANLEGITGCSELLESVENVGRFSHIALACGTGTTLTGLISKEGSSAKVLGFQVLKGEGYLKAEINQLLKEHQLSAHRHWSINDEFHCGGYAKVTAQLTAFIEAFESRQGIALEPVYSGKMMMGLYSLIKTNTFPEGSHILAIHGGGLQGRRGFKII